MKFGMANNFMKINEEVRRILCDSTYHLILVGSKFDRIRHLPLKLSFISKLEKPNPARLLNKFSGYHTIILLRVKAKVKKGKLKRSEKKD